MKRSYFYWSVTLLLAMGFLAIFFVPEGKNAIFGGGVTTLDYYVDISNGADDPAHGASSLNGAWKTLHYAIEQINAKETGFYVLHVASGEYSEVKGENTSTNILITQANLTIRGEGSTRPIVQGGGSWVTAFEISSEANNVTIDHLEIIGFDSERAAITVAGKDVSIRGCDIHNNSEGIHIVSGRNDTVHIFENEISDTDIGISSERSSKLIIERNSIHDNNTGILTYGGTIKNNLIYDNQLKGVEAGGKTYIYHNTLDGGGIHGSVGIQLPNAKAVPTIKYNIITGFDVGIQRAKGTGTAILDYNDLWNNVTNYEGVASGRHDISEDPRYSDPANADFTPQDGSPCIDAIPISSSYPVTEDFDNNPRPQGNGYDIGAYEKQTTDVLAMNGCTYLLSPTDATFTSSGGPGSLDLTVTSGSGCSWTAGTLDSWITNISPSSGSDPGPWTVNYSVGANSGLPRFGTMTIAGQNFTVNQKGITGITVNSAPNPSTYGESVTFTASTTVSAPTPTGTVDFFDGGTFLDSGELIGLSASISTSALTAGTHSITAVYSGDYNFDPSSSNLLSQTVDRATTSTLVTSDNNPSTYGQPVSFTATVEIGGGSGAKGGVRKPLKSRKKGVPSMIAETATGTVQFNIDGSNFGIPVPLTGGIATSDVTSSLSVGNHTVTAVYSGDGNYDTSTGTLTPDQTVDRATTSTLVTSDNNPSTYGQPVSFTATVEIGGGSGAKGGVRKPLQSRKKGVPSMIAETATGTVQFNIDGSNFGIPVPLTGGIATSDVTSSLSVGNHTVTAVYSGEGNYDTSTGTLTPDQTVDRATTSTLVTSDNNPSTYGEPVSFTATVEIGGGSGAKGGVRKPLKSRKKGVPSMIAETATGTVQFNIDGSNFGIPVPLTGGIATSDVTSSLSVGNHTVTAVYSGDGNYDTSTGTLSGSQTVNPTLGYTVATNPPGLHVTVDGTLYVGPQVFTWAIGSSHTISAPSPQSGGAGTQYVFLSWSDGGAQGHTVTAPSSSATYTANFTTQYSLTSSVSPPEGGTVTPSGVNWYNSGQTVSVLATPSSGYTFSSWSGDLSGSTNPASLLMYGPKNVTANFSVEVAPCDYSIFPTSQNIGKEGGIVNISITTGNVCQWRAWSNASWITMTSGGSGIGSSAMSYSVAANTGPARTGTVTIAGQTFTVNQESGFCTFAINPGSTSPPSSGGSGYTVSVTAGAGCAWTATSNAPWITINSGGSGTGNGTVTYSVAANPGPARTGTLTIAGQTFTVRQASACTYAIDPTSVSSPPSGGTGSVGVTAGNSCQWTAASNVSWITITSGVSGVGNGTVNYSVEANTGAARDGTMTIAGQTFTVHQAAGCDLAVNPTYASYASSGGTNTVIVTAPSSTCTWEATSNDPWITIKSVESAGGKSSGRAGKKLNVSGASYSGSGKVTYSVEANTGPARDGTMTIAGQTVTIHQESGCSYGIDSTSAEVPYGGSAGSVGVTAGNGCQWTAASNVLWISITSGASGTGSGGVSYSVAANTGPARDGTLTIAGQTFTIHQAAAIYNLTVNITGNGTLRFDPPPPFPAGTKVTVYLEPADGFDVLDIIVDGVSMKAVFPMWPVYTFTFGDFSENHTITIIFG